MNTRVAPPRYGDVMKDQPRASDDWYCDPPEAIEALLDVERFAGNSIDPSCGRGTIPKALIARGLHCRATDLVHRGYGEGGLDFFAGPYLGFDNVIANCPYKVAQAYAERALKIARHKVALLLPLTFLEGSKRSAWLATSPLARVHVFPWRISMPPGEMLQAGEVEPVGGKKAYAWFVWEKGWQGPPQIRWLERPANVTADRPQDAAA